MSEFDQGGRPRLLRSFGRRRGRKLSPRQDTLMQDLLPRLAIDLMQPAAGDLSVLFPKRVSQVWLEIGFGGAEHLLWQARTHADIGIIGAEPFEDGVVKALAGVADGELDNIRLHADDVRPLLDWLPTASLERAFVLFPDPWPKKRHAKRRLVSDRLLSDLSRVLKSGGELRLATDIMAYARDMLLAVRRNGQFSWTATGPDDWRSRRRDWPQTRYEQKALREARAPTFIRLVRT